MKGQTGREKLDRRGFFKKAGAAVGIAGAGIVALGGGGKVKAATAPKKSGGYRETAHVRTYYELAKF